MVKLELDFSRLISEIEISSKSPDYTSEITGNFISNFKGQGLEFENFRDYTPEDDSKKIDWLASTKADKLLIREFVEERGITFFILVDVSYGMFFTSAEKLKCEVAAEVCANLAFSIVEANDKVGIGLFDKKIKDYLLPATGKPHFHKILEKLKNNEIYGGEKSYLNSFQQINNIIKDKIILIIISDFLDFKEEDMESLKLFGKKFDIIGYMIRDYKELELESKTGLICVEDINTMEQIIVNINDIKEEYYNLMLQDELNVKKFFLSNDFGFFKMYTRDDLYSSVIKFMNMRGKWS